MEVCISRTQTSRSLHMLYNIYIYTVCIYSSIFIISLLFTVVGSDCCVHFNQYIVHISIGNKNPTNIEQISLKNQMLAPCPKISPMKKNRSEKARPKNGESITMMKLSYK